MLYGVQDFLHPHSTLRLHPWPPPAKNFLKPIKINKIVEILKERQSNPKMFSINIIEIKWKPIDVNDTWRGANGTWGTQAARQKMHRIAKRCGWGGSAVGDWPKFQILRCWDIEIRDKLVRGREGGKPLFVHKKIYSARLRLCTAAPVYQDFMRK